MPTCMLSFACAILAAPSIGTVRSTDDPVLQQAYLKASNTDAQDEFGVSLAVFGDTVVVGAWSEDSSATGVNGDDTDEGAPLAGAAYGGVGIPDCVRSGEKAAEKIVNHLRDT